MGTSAPSRLRIPLRCNREAPAAARRAMCSMSGLGAALGDALLVASELVSNAVRHSGCEENDPLDVLVERADDRLLISVRDPGRSGQEARIPAAENLPFGGVGLRIVDRLATCWGSNRDHGYVVWAELPLVACAPVQVTRWRQAAVPARSSDGRRPRTRRRDRPCSPGPA